jgi:hypothetical protein
MKTVKTSTGIKQIEDWDANLVPLQLREILQDQRKALIDRLLKENNLPVYVSHKLGLKMNSRQYSKVRDGLNRLMNAGIDIDNYQPILAMVLKKEKTVLDTAVFYKEIDNCIQVSMQDHQLIIPELDAPRLNSADLLEILHRDLIEKILTEDGLQEFSKEHYGQKVEDKAKVKYIIAELRDFYANAQTDYVELLKLIKEEQGNLHNGIEHHFEIEVIGILTKHFPK